MTPDEITQVLTRRFAEAVDVIPPDSWQVEAGHLRLLVLLSNDQHWLRALVSIVPAQTVQPFLEMLLTENFDNTQETRYALYQGVLWGVFHHACATLTLPEFEAVVDRLVQLQTQGLDPFYGQLIEGQIRQIIYMAKQQGQSMEVTMQTLDRFYAEGVMGDLSQSPEQRRATLTAWRSQLERLWPDVDSEAS
jgi:hypothetical protein